MRVCWWLKETNSKYSYHIVMYIDFIYDVMYILKWKSWIGVDGRGRWLSEEVSYWHFLYIYIYFNNVMYIVLLISEWFANIRILECYVHIHNCYFTQLLDGKDYFVHTGYHTMTCSWISLKRVYVMISTFVTLNCTIISPHTLLIYNQITISMLCFIMGCQWLSFKRYSVSLLLFIVGVVSNSWISFHSLCSDSFWCCWLLAAGGPYKRLNSKYCGILSMHKHIFFYQVYFLSQIIC